MESVIVIPARMQSERLPGKPLLVADERSLLQHVYERTLRTKTDNAIAATPDDVIAIHCIEKGMPYQATRKSSPTGTHRCAEVLHRLDVADKKQTDRIVVNWQCDEPLIEPEWVDRLVDRVRMRNNEIATLVAPLDKREDNVEVAVSRGRCHWFSRFSLAGAMAHIGVYAFRSDVLRSLGKLPSSELSKAASLEQLAWLEFGYIIEAVEVDKPTLAINTQDDYEKFKETFDEDD